VAAIADDIARLEQDIRRQLERASTASERLATTVRDALYVGEEHPRLRLKWLAEVRVSNVDKKSYEDQLPVLLCNYTDVYYNRQIVAGMEFMAATATSDQIARFGLRSGDVLVTKDSETADDIAIPSLVSKDMPGVVCGYHLAIIRPGRRLDGRYLYWHLASPVARQYFDALATGVTRVGIRAEHIENLVINVPPLTVQAAIAEALDDEALRVEAIKGDVLRQLDLLDERRVALSAGLALEGVLAR
jgi:type I restriction enzyme S subunit